MISISNKNESTRYPFWVIIDPKQNFKINIDGVYNVSHMITGVWFSRKAAQEFLDRTRYNFSKNAKVFCMSGCYSDDWEEFSRENTEK